MYLGCHTSADIRRDCQSVSNFYRNVAQYSSRKIFGISGKGIRYLQTKQADINPYICGQ